MTDTILRPGVPDDGAASRPTHVADIPVRSLVALAGLVTVLVLVLAAIDRAQQLFGLALLAAIMTAVLGPAVERLGRVIGGTAATVLLHLLVLAGVTVVVGLAVAEIRTQADALDAHLDRELFELQLEEGPSLLSRIGLSQRLDDHLASFGTIAVVGDDETTAMIARFSQLAIVVVLSGFLARHGERVVSTVIRMTGDRDRRRFLWHVWRDAVGTAARFLRRSFGAGVLSAGLALAVGLAFSLPGTGLLAMWAGATALVPLFGILVGWSPIVLVAVFTESSGSAIGVAMAAAGAAIGLTWCRSRLLNLDFGPTRLVSAVGIAAGLSAAGAAGAIAGLFLAIAIARAATHDWTGVFASTPSPEAHRAPADDPAGSSAAGPAAGDGYRWDHRLSLTLSPRTAVRVAALVIVAFLLQRWVARVGLPLVWAIVGLVVAVGVDRPLTWIERRTRAPRWILAAAGSVAAIGVVVALGFAAGPELRAVVDVEDELPELVATLEGLPVVGDRFAAAGLEERFDEFELEAPSWLSRSPLAGRAVDLIGGGLLGIFWVLTIAGAAVLDGPQLTGAIVRRTPARFHRQTVRLGRVARDAIAGYAAGSALVALLNGLIVTSLALVFGVPLALPLGLWALAWNFIPQFGAIVGWAPFLVLAFATGPVTGVLLLAIFVLYQAVENNLIQPTIVGRAVDISALAALGAALLGAAVGGLIGAVLAVPAVGVVRAIVLDVRRPDFPRVGLASRAVDGS